MEAIEENTVSSKNQMINSDTIRYYGDPAASRILIVGNSITRHGRLPSIGWNNDWGMAASAEDKDYVHLLMKKWEGRKKRYFLCVRQAACWEVMLNENKTELSEFAEARRFGAELIVFRLGENISTGIDREFFRRSLSEFIGYLNPGDGKVVYTTSFWKNPTVSGVVREAAEESGGAAVELEDLGELPEMKAYGLFGHDGVCAHPGDRGMAAIAERIDKAIREAEGFREDYVERIQDL